MALPEELLESVKQLESPLGAALYGVAKYEPLARELERVGASLRRNFQAAKAGNRDLVAGIADYRNEVIPAELASAADGAFVGALARTVAALNGALNEFQNAVQLCKQLESPEVAASVGSLAELQGTLEVILSIVDPPAEPEE